MVKGRTQETLPDGTISFAIAGTGERDDASGTRQVYRMVFVRSLTHPAILTSAAAAGTTAIATTVIAAGAATATAAATAAAAAAAARRHRRHHRRHRRCRPRLRRPRPAVRMSARPCWRCGRISALTPVLRVPSVR